MADRTAIEWADASWNPVRARHRGTGRVGWYCVRVSAGCKPCYAAGMNRRLGTGLDYKPGYADQIEHFLDEKILVQPLRWRRPRMIFPFSMSDIGGDWVEFEWLDRIFAVAALTPQHTYMVLTKRPERLLEYLTVRPRAVPDGMIDPRNSRRHVIYGLLAGVTSAKWGQEPEVVAKRMDALFNGGWPLPNVWVGVSVEDQPTFDERWSYVRRIPAAVRWFSYEPALAPIDFAAALEPAVGTARELAPGQYETTFQKADLIICGGCSGGLHVPTFELNNARRALAQCRRAGVSFFMKQLGNKPTDSGVPYGEWSKNNKHGDLGDFPADLRVREMPNVRPA